ncbi:MAG: caspase family protein [Deltaproteobacteria bacterium]|nr:caspase family protein [Deltaproteobacteria bacterium]
MSCLAHRLTRILILLAAAGLVLPATAATRRFALITAANDGGPDRTRLRFARSDAEAVSDLLSELGGVAGADRILALNTDREGLEQALVTARERLQAAAGSADRIELIFYYSGHSDEEGLLLGKERYGYRELRKALEAMKTDVRIAVLDSCASGALTRAKGGVARAPFLVDDSRQVKGQAILTSSSADEASQESDRIGGSFFTHYLVSGLRGAADSDADQTVTLAEAYQFAFRETLARTERTQGGAQHPNYDFQLSGTGDVVMTDLRQASSTLVIAAELGGRVYLRDTAGHLVAELKKPAGSPVVLGLQPGTYEITLDDGQQLSAGRITLESGTPAGLGPEGLRIIPREVAVARGEFPPADLARIEDRFFGFGLLPLPPQHAYRHSLQLHLLGARSTALDGLALGFGLSLVDEEMQGLQLSLVGNSAGRGSGAQIAVGGNRLAGSSRMLQVAAGGNIARGHLRWGQLAAGFNIVGGDTSGVQLSAGFNITSGDLKGLQATAGFNVAGEVRGGQLAAGFNVAHGPVHGAQLSAGFNITPELKGTQLSVLNVTTKLEGWQIGVVNVAVDGSEGEAIGVLNFIGGGIHRFRLWGDDLHGLNAGLKLGSRHVYSLISMGMAPGSSPLRFTAQFGLGVEQKLIGPLSLNLELTGGSEHFGTWNMAGYSLVGRFSALAVVKLWKVRVVGGVGLNGFFSDQGDRADLAWLGPQFTYTSGRHTGRIWPGLVLGLEL